MQLERGLAWPQHLVDRVEDEGVGDELAARRRSSEQCARASRRASAELVLARRCLLDPWLELGAQPCTNLVRDEPLDDGGAVVEHRLGDLCTGGGRVEAADVHYESAFKVRRISSPRLAGTS